VPNHATCPECAGSSTAESPRATGGYEAGQSGVGDIFGWFVKQGVPPAYHEAAAGRGIGVHEYLTDLASGQRIGEHGLARDWHSGNRSVLVDHERSGLIVGQTLATRPEDIYGALLEATAFGTRTSSKRSNPPVCR
jgi:L-ribulokinase